MKRTFKDVALFKFMGVLASFALTACGSGGGNDPIDLSGPPGTGVCNQAVSQAIDINGGSVQSKDGKATVVIAPNAIQTGSVTFTITVQCSVQQSFDGFAYAVSFPATNATPPAYRISIQFEGTAPAGVILKLGIYTGDPNQLWQDVLGSFQNNVAQVDGRNNADTYGVFVQSSGGQGSPPSQPGKPQPKAASNVCRIDITWSPSTDPDHDLTSYNVFRDNSLSPIGTVPANQAACCTFRDHDRLPLNPLRAGSHIYSIQAIDARDNSSDRADSNSVPAPPPPICPVF